jgi:imidazole glycerol phosphate synthase glutamine amidotransferase subunit
MKKVRIIARLDVKGPNVIKGVSFECLRVVGKPNELAIKYCQHGADELVYIDCVASLFGRQNLLNIVNKASNDIFIPFTVGGGVRTLEDVQAFLKAGADKVAINTAAVKDPDLIRKAAERFGTQCIVISIEAKKVSEQNETPKWEAYTDSGREATGLDVIEWAKKAEQLGAGEILLTSVDQEGSESGYDLELIQEVCKVVSIPVVASGGAGKTHDFAECAKIKGVNALACASLLHYNRITIPEIKKAVYSTGVNTRKTESKHIEKDDEKFQNTCNYNEFTLNHIKQIERENTLDGINESVSTECIQYSVDEADVSIIDYGLNNLKSISKAFETIGKKIRVIRTPEEVLASKCLVLPGIGAYGDGIEHIRERRLEDAIKKKVKEGTPLLGICLGMQLLFSESDEFGVHKGLNLIEGRVITMSIPEDMMKDYKVPHIGWNSINLPRNNVWRGTLLNSTKDNDEFYFVHSFYPVPKDPNHVLATTEYGGNVFCSVVKCENIMGTQFHPEKSGEAGLNILREFCRMVKK